MKVNPEIYAKLSAIDWFSRSGLEPPSDLPFDLQRAPDVAAAIASARSSSWQDAGTAAQGELTGYLARTNYDVYGTSWNPLARTLRERMQTEIMPAVKEALARISAEVLSEVVLLDLNRIALQAAFRERFKRAPDFYQRLLVVYERGHLPCGWVGELDSWPKGQLVVY
jgi:hypothetical protein